MTEALLAEIDRELLELRLGRRWGAVVVPTLQRWAEDGRVDADAYRAARIGKSTKKPAPKPKKGPEKKRARER